MCGNPFENLINRAEFKSSEFKIQLEKYFENAKWRTGPIDAATQIETNMTSKAIIIPRVSATGRHVNGGAAVGGGASPSGVLDASGSGGSSTCGSTHGLSTGECDPGSEERIIDRFPTALNAAIQAGER
jgi:hypothetical protein